MMAEDLAAQFEFMRPLVDLWTRKFELAHKSKSAFQAMGDQCNSFFAHACGFMWQDAYRNKHMGKGITKPKFEITINKAFELVAIFGPYLFWKYPFRSINSPDPIELIPELFSMDEFGQWEYQQALQEDAWNIARGKYRNRLMEKYLNYSQREQPGGGLAVEAELSITEALVRGRGVFGVKAYKMPGSDDFLTGCFHISVNDLLIDPDCKDPTLQSAKWIAIRHETPDWELEDMMNVPRGTFKGRGKFESLDSYSNQTDAARMHRSNGQSNDMIVWYEVWSKCGIGSRMNQMGAGEGEEARVLPANLQSAFDRAVGDYAYLCIAPGIPWPLNAPSGLIRRLNKDEEVKKLFRWRAVGFGPEFPCHKDGRWPVVVLDFYRNPQSAWPIPPLAPALGELTALNVLMSALVEQGYENRKSYLAYLASAKKVVEAALKSSDNPATIELNEMGVTNLNQIIQFLGRPEMNKDILTAIEYLMELFDKRTGLTEIHYAMNVGGVQSRTARDTAAKEEKASIRPEKMSQDVARCMSELAQLEKFLAGWVVRGKPLTPLLGRRGAMYWDQLIATEDPEIIVREMSAMVEASDVRRPNKERLTANLQQMLQFLFPVLKEYAEITGDTGPLNEFLESFGESIDQDLRAWKLGPWSPQANPEAQQMQQEMMELEKLKLESDVLKGQMAAEKTKMDMEKTRLDTMLAMQQGEADMRSRQLELQFDQAEGEQGLVQDRKKFEQELLFDSARFQQEIQQGRAEFMQTLAQRQAEARQKFNVMQQESQIKMRASKEQADIKKSSAEEQAKIKVKQARAMPKKPAANGAKK
jgi:hypothetical protein